MRIFSHELSNFIIDDEDEMKKEPEAMFYVHSKIVRTTDVQ